MASHKFREYKESNTSHHKDILTEEGKTVTLKQLQSLQGENYYAGIVDDHISRLLTCMDEQQIEQSKIKLSYGYDSLWRLLVMNNGKCIIEIPVGDSQTKAALHDLFQGARVEKIRQNTTKQHKSV